MKIDHFAKFRGSYIQNPGNTGNRGTDPEKPSEINDFPGRGAVPRNLELRGTGEQARTLEPDQESGEAAGERKNLFPVPQYSEESGNSPEPEKKAAKEALFESVPRVPHVPQENKDGRGRNSICDVVPDSRHPLISDAVRAKLEQIEAEARRLGWPRELLWNSQFWGFPRGLAAVLEDTDDIVEVTTEFISILKFRRSLLRFQRHIA